MTLHGLYDRVDVSSSLGVGQHWRYPSQRNRLITGFDSNVLSRMPDPSMCGIDDIP